MTSDLNLHLDSKSESPEDARHREAKQVEGDAIQVSQMHPMLPDLHTHRRALGAVLGTENTAQPAVQLRLMLPDGKEETLAAKLGQTVQYTKAVIHERFEVPIERQV